MKVKYRDSERHLDIMAKMDRVPVLRALLLGIDAQATRFGLFDPDALVRGKQQLKLALLDLNGQGLIRFDRKWKGGDDPKPWMRLTWRGRIVIWALKTQDKVDELRKKVRE